MRHLSGTCLLRNQMETAASTKQRVEETVTFSHSVCLNFVSTDILPSPGYVSSCLISHKES